MVPPATITALASLTISVKWTEGFNRRNLMLLPLNRADGIRKTPRMNCIIYALCVLMEFIFYNLIYIEIFTSGLKYNNETHHYFTQCLWFTEQPNENYSHAWLISKLCVRRMQVTLFVNDDASVPVCIGKGFKEGLNLHEWGLGGGQVLLTNTKLAAIWVCNTHTHTHPLWLLQFMNK